MTFSDSRIQAERLGKYFKGLGRRSKYETGYKCNKKSRKGSGNWIKLGNAAVGKNPTAALSTITDISFFIMVKLFILGKLVKI